MNKKELGVVFSVFGAATLGIVAMASYEASNRQHDVFRQIQAVSVNTDAFDQRNADGTFTLGANTGYTENGYLYDVTDAPDYNDDWKLGPICYALPVEANKAYYFEFAFSIEGAKGENEEGVVGKGSAVRTAVMEHADKSYEAKHKADGGYVGDFSGGTCWSGVEYTTNNDETLVEVNLKLGHVGVNSIESSTRDKQFTVLVKEFVIKEKDNAGRLLKKVSFESGNSFATNWNTHHDAVDMCSEENINNTKGWIDSYCSLTPEQREIVDDTNDSVYADTKIGAAIRTIATLINYPIE